MSREFFGLIWYLGGSLLERWTPKQHLRLPSMYGIFFGDVFSVVFNRLADYLCNRPLFLVRYVAKRLVLRFFYCRKQGNRFFQFFHDVKSSQLELINL